MKFHIWYVVVRKAAEHQTINQKTRTQRDGRSFVVFSHQCSQSSREGGLSMHCDRVASPMSDSQYARDYNYNPILRIHLEFLVS